MKHKWYCSQPCSPRYLFKQNQSAFIPGSTHTYIHRHMHTQLLCTAVLYNKINLPLNRTTCVMENMRCLSGLRACWRQSGRGKGSEKGLHDFIYLFRILDSAIKHIIYCHLHYALKKNLSHCCPLRCCRWYKVSLNKTAQSKVIIFIYCKVCCSLTVCSTVWLRCEVTAKKAHFEQGKQLEHLATFSWKYHIWNSSKWLFPCKIIWCRAVNKLHSCYWGYHLSSINASSQMRTFLYCLFSASVIKIDESSEDVIFFFLLQK